MITGELIVITNETFGLWEADFAEYRASMEEYKRLFTETESDGGRLVSITCGFCEDRYVANLFCPEDVDDLLIVLDMRIATFQLRRRLENALRMLRDHLEEEVVCG